MLIASFSTIVYAAPHSKNVSYEDSEIKVFSKQEIDGYLNGRGMGMAKPAELNHFPGPMHVLDLATELGLTKNQISETQKIYESMRTKAVEYGHMLIDKEREIERLFLSQNISPSSLDKLLLQSADIKANLRSVHLRAHLVLKSVLNEFQVKKYDELRGYVGDQLHKHSHRH